jgi:hypothetical protein
MTDLSKRLREEADDAAWNVGSNALSRVLTEAADALDARWQTMESAPRNGTPILVWPDEIGDVTVALAFSDYPDWWVPSGGGDGRLAPTHWARIPDPPTPPEDE